MDAKKIDPETIFSFVKKWGGKLFMVCLLLLAVVQLFSWGCGAVHRITQKQGVGNGKHPSPPFITPALPSQIMVGERPVTLTVGPEFGTRINHSPSRYIKWDVVETNGEKIQFRFANGQVSPWIPVGTWSGKQEQRTQWRFSYEPHRHAPFQVRTERGEVLMEFSLRPFGWKG